MNLRGNEETGSDVKAHIEFQQANLREQQYLTTQAARLTSELAGG